jgi:hypothetical protein
MAHRREGRKNWTVVDEEWSLNRVARRAARAQERREEKRERRRPDVDVPWVSVTAKLVVSEGPGSSGRD